MVLFRKCFMNRIIIIGGSGYLGTELAEELSKELYKITIADINSPETSKYEYIKADLLNEKRLEGINQEYDIIVNLTGQVTYPMEKCFKLNTTGIENLINYAEKSYAHIIQISTVAIYGTVLTADENTAINPETPYATSKAFAEYRIQKTYHAGKHTILRLSNLYGGRQKKGIFAYLKESRNNKTDLYFDNDGTLTRYYLNVLDCVQALKQTIKRQLTGIYNVAGDKKYSIKELVSLFEKATSQRLNVYYQNIKPKENINNLKCEKFKKAFDFQPSYNVEEFIKEIINEK